MKTNENTLKCDYLIIGGGIAGVSCINHLYSFGNIEKNNEKVILVSSNDYIKIPKIECKITQTLNEISSIIVKCDGVFGKYKNFQFLNGILSEIFPKQHTVVIRMTVDGHLISELKTIIHYKKLVLCTGARPNTLPIQVEEAIYLRDRDSAETFVKALSNSTSVCIVGNGGIALELIYTLEHCSITWIVRTKNIGHAFYDEATSLFLQDYVNCKLKLDASECKTPIDKSSTLDKTKGEVIRVDHFGAYLNEKFGYSLGPNWHKHIDFSRIMKEKSDKIVDIKLETEIIKVVINPDNYPHKYTVTLSTGETLSTDTIIVAIGVIPTTDYLVGDKQSFEKDSIGAIKVNHLMETSLKDIYAAGDCCCVELPPPTLEDNDRVNCWFQKRIWGQAIYMGLRAAEIISQPEPSILTLMAIMLGKYNIDENSRDDTEILLRINKEYCEYIRCVVVNDRMVGALFIGRFDQTFELAETFENLILNQTNLQSLKEHLLDPEIDISDYFD